MWEVRSVNNKNCSCCPCLSPSLTAAGFLLQINNIDTWTHCPLQVNLRNSSCMLNTMNSMSQKPQNRRVRFHFMADSFIQLKCVNSYLSLTKFEYLTLKWIWMNNGLIIIELFCIKPVIPWTPTLWNMHTESQQIYSLILYMCCTMHIL